MPGLTLPPTIRAIVDRVLGWRVVVRLQAMLAAYNQAGDGLLASGLAYGALFAALTGLVFTVGLVGFVVDDPAARERLVQAIAGEIPPLEPIVRDGLLAVASNAGTISILGLIALGWSASQFYGSIDGAFARIFQHVPERGRIARIARGLISVALVVVGLAAAIVTSTLEVYLDRDLPPGPEGDAARAVASAALAGIALLVVIVATALTYRLVPNTHVPWRALGTPAIVAGIALGALTELFVFLAPRLVGVLSVFGGFAAVFATLIWLSWAFQVLLLGATWVHARMDEADHGLEGQGPPAPTETGHRLEGGRGGG